MVDHYKKIDYNKISILGAAWKPVWLFVRFLAVEKKKTKIGKATGFAKGNLFKFFIIDVFRCDGIKFYLSSFTDS